MKRTVNIIADIILIAAVLFLFIKGVNHNENVTITDLTPEILEIDPAILDAVLHIESDMGWSGSGIVIDANTVLTAGHMVEGINYLTLFLDDDRDDTIDSNNFYNYEFDSAIIELPYNINIKPLKIGDSNDLKVGDTIYVIGYPFAVNTDIVTKGIVSSIKLRVKLFGNIDLIASSAASLPGNSGGAVLNSKGELIGILVGCFTGYSSPSFIVPINALFPELTKHLEGV